MFASGTNRYYLSAPPSWDGKRPIGILLFFHGYKSSGRETIANTVVREAAHRGGYLLVAADGIEGTWSHTGSPTQLRNEIDYVKGLLEDLTRRLPVDTRNMWVSGFSQGGSMAWEAACYLGKRFKAFVPIAGAFWNPLPATCPGGPVNILHIHGTGDRTVPMMGRPIGPFRQGEVMKSWAVMKASAQCTPAAQSARDIARYRCETWFGCGSGNRLELCLHPAGHEIPKDWADLAYGFLAKIGK